MPGAVYRLPALLVPFGLLLVAGALSAGVSRMAVHLCGWPATVSCDLGVPMVWTALRGGLWAAAVAGAADGVRFVRDADAAAGYRLALWALWGPAVVVATWTTMRDRTLEMPDLLAGALVVIASLILVGWAFVAAMPRRRHRFVIGAVVAAPAVATLLVPWWGPPLFVAAEHPSAERVEQDRRRDLEHCLREQERLRRSGPEVALPACEAVPSTDAPLPPVP